MQILCDTGSRRLWYATHFSRAHAQKNAHAQKKWVLGDKTPIKLKAAVKPVDEKKKKKIIPLSCFIPFNKSATRELGAVKCSKNSSRQPVDGARL